MIDVDKPQGVLGRANTVSEYFKEEYETYVSTRKNDKILMSAITYEVIFPGENKLKLNSLAFPIVTPDYAFIFYEGCGRPAKVCVEQVMKRVGYNDHEGLLRIIEHSIKKPVKIPPRKKEDIYKTFRE
jgi:hypothetical protein